MAIAFGAAGTLLNVTTATTTFSVAYPAGITAGQLLVLFISSNGGAPSATPPTGWTEVFREASTVTNPRGALYIKVATGSESGTLAVTMTSTTGCARMFRYTGVDTTTPQDATRTIVENSGTTVAHVILPSITTVTAGAMLVFVGSWNSGSRTATPPAGATERSDFIADGGTAKAGSINDEIVASAGATGTRTITSSSATGIANWGAMMALRPAVTSTPGNVTAVAATATAAAVAPVVSDGAVRVSVRDTSNGNTQDTAVGTNLTLARPAGTVDGDLLLAVIIQDQDASVKTGMAAPTGWTKIANSGGTGWTTAKGQTALYTHTAASGDPASWNWTNDSTGQPDIHGAILAIANSTGTVASGPTFQYSSAVGTAYTAPSVTGTDKGLLVCAFCRSDSTNGTGSFTMSAPLTEIIDINASTAWTGLGIGIEQLTASGATGTRSATNTDSASWTTVSLAFDPLSPSGNVTAVAATGTANALAPTVSAGATVTAVVATGTAAAPAPVIGTGGAVAAIKATATATALAPTLQTGATVTAVAATAAAAGQAPSLAYGYTLQAIKATATSAGLAPTVGAGSTVAGLAASVAVTALAPSVSAGGATSVSAVPATVTVQGIPPTVGAGTTQAAVKATATAAAVAPVVTGNRAGQVQAVAATVTATALAPGVDAGQTTTVQAVKATATAAGVVPSIFAFATISPAVIPVSVTAPAPGWSGGVTITAPAATGSAAANPATASTFAGVTAPAAPVTASASAPAISYGVTVVVVRATATAASVVPQNVQGDRAVSLTAVRAVVTGSAPAPGVQAFMAVLANPPRATAAVATYAPTVRGAASVTAVRSQITVQAKPVVLMGTLRDLALSGAPLQSTATVASLGTRLSGQPIEYSIRSGVPLYGPITTEPLYGRFRIEE